MNRSLIIIGTGLVTLLGGLVADRVVTGLVMANAAYGVTALPGEAQAAPRLGPDGRVSTFAGKRL